jgi:flavorubredoxin
MRKIADRVSYAGVVDWDRRLFDALVPLPDGTSYNAYYVQGNERAALLDTVDPSMIATFLESLDQMSRVDYLVSHHAEQDHSGLIPEVLGRFPDARLLATVAGRNLLQDLLHVPGDRIDVVKDGDAIDLGGRTLRFVSTPWVHWPETMCTWLEDERILFSGDFFASHLASSDLYATGDHRLMESAKRYYAEIMMPYASIVRKNIDKVAALDVRLIAPSHGPLHDRPAEIIETWRRWTDPIPGREVLVAYVSMHGSTKMLVDRLCAALTKAGVSYRRFDLTVADAGHIAMALLDASTLVLATPAVLNSVHPLVAYAAYLANALKPKLRWAAMLGSFGWGGKPLEQGAALMPDLKLEWLPPCLFKGQARPADLGRVDQLAAAIAERHATLDALLPKSEIRNPKLEANSKS